MKKRLFSALLFLALPLTALPFATVAADTVPSGYAAIRTETDRQKIANNMAGKSILMNDITMTATWASWGYNSSTNYTVFTGILDGNGYTISGYKAGGNSCLRPTGRQSDSHSNLQGPETRLRLPPTAPPKQAMLVFFRRCY